MLRNALIATVCAAGLLAGCDVPAESSEDFSVIGQAMEEGGGGEFPRPVTLGDFSGEWFPSDRVVTFVEKAEEGDGYRALGIDVANGRIAYQIVGPREEGPKVLQRLAEAGLNVRGCGIGQGVFTPPPVPVPQCGGLRCDTDGYLTKAAHIAEMSCPPR